MCVVMCNVAAERIRFVFVSRMLLCVERSKRIVRDRGRRMLGEQRKQHYQRRASKTISCVSWVICDPAFFWLQRAAVCWNTASGRVKGGEMRGWSREREGGADFSNKCWHQACLILDSGNSLICYRLWNSSNVLQRGKLATTVPWEQEEWAECNRAGGTSVQL